MLCEADCVKTPAVLAPESARAIVAFQAKRENNRTPQQFGIRGSMRGVAGVTALDAHARMLEHEGTALIDVAFEAWLLIVERRSHQCATGSGAPCRGEGVPCGIVAIRALDHAFIHAMLYRHFELRANGCMAGIAKLGLLFGQQKFGRCGLVDGMAVGTDNIGFGVRGTPNIRAGHVLRVALETGIQRSFGADREKARIVALPPRAATWFAAGPWHPSHPVLAGVSLPEAIDLKCGFLLKFCHTSGWQVLQTSLPTKRFGVCPAVRGAG